MSRLAGRTLLMRNTVFNLIGFGAPLLVALVALPIVTRGLDPASFGVLGLAWIVFGLVAELGFGRATTKFAAEHVDADDRDQLARVTWTALSVQLALGVVGGAVLLAGAQLLVHEVLRVPAALEPGAVAAFRALAVALPVVILGAALRGLLEALQRFDLVNLVRAPANAANFAAPAVGVLLGWNIAGIVTLLAVLRTLMTIAYGWQCVRLVPELRAPRLAHGDLRRILAFGGWTSISGVVSPLLVTVERFLLGALASVAAVGLYTAAYEVAARLLILPASLVATLLPAFSALDAAGGRARARHLARVAARRILYVLGPIVAALLLFAPGLLGVWLGDVYAGESATALRILSVGVLINALAHVPDTLLRAIGRPDVPAKLHMLELPVHLALAAVLINRFGVIGAAWAWTVRVSCDALLLAWAARRVTADGGSGPASFVPVGARAAERQA